MSAVVAADLFRLYRAQHGHVAALRGLSLRVADGEVVSVLGPSGSGKTTLLGLCAGVGRPSSGELTVLGHDFGQASATEIGAVRQHDIGLVRQHYHLALPRELTVEEIVAFPLRLLGRFGRDERSRVAGLLRSAGLERHARALPDELSGGEQQRVAVCAALAKRPRLLLADEPTGELDAQATRRVVDLILELAADSGAAALIVTHDPTVAAATARTIHIRDGRLAAEGTMEPVLIVDEQGWLRLPRRLREEAGVRERVRAHARRGQVTLLAQADGPESARAQQETAPRLDAAEKRTAEIAVAGVGKRLGDPEQEIVRDLTWTFTPEKLHVIAGPSGSGKTTLLGLLAALDNPDEGEIWVGGERIDGLAPDDAAHFRRRVIGYVSQHSTVVDFLTARENVELALSLHGFDREQSRRRAERVLAWVGLGKLGDRRADRLSGGEQRRVALARALAPAPRVLLADEPTAHLDRLTGRLIIKLLKRAAAESGTTVVAASHDPDVIAAADEVLALDA
jgi:ABC-type lipoprotein export system ATPase subunit